MAESTRREFFAIEPAGAAADAQSQALTTAAQCPVCHHHFSGTDARFCPFDGEPLVASNSWNPSANPLLGTVIDKRYEVLEVLGEGGMGTVYLAQDSTLDRPVALKFLSRHLEQQDEARRRFLH
ncbi:MAG TPA: hypothetical protein VI072_04715, partial [Polyangiaceae bacterium]